MLKINNLSVIKRKKILRNVSLTIPSGRISLLLGKSGSGKTTLLRCIAQLEKDYEGEIVYGGKNLNSIANRSELLGFVPQNYALFPHLNVLDNCAQPISLRIGKKAAYLEAGKMLRDLDMDGHLSSFPHELSGGQQQRAALARSLMLNPSFLLLDEPTSSLDPENTQLLIGLIQRLKREGKGLIISTQDMSFAEKILDRAFFIENGSLIEDYEGGDPLSPKSKLYEFLKQVLRGR